MSKCTPVYLSCHYDPDDDNSFLGPLEITIAYHEIESDELNEKIANLIKEFEKKYLGKE